MITLTGARTVGRWQIARDGQPVAMWQRTEHGARITDLTGECVAVISTLAGSQSAAVASMGAHAGDWSDLAHKVLAGECEMIAGEIPAASGVCILTGERGENADDCTTHEHEAPAPGFCAGCQPHEHDTCPGTDGCPCCIETARQYAEDLSA